MRPYATSVGGLTMLVCLTVSFVSRSLAHSLIIFLYNLETDKEKRKRWRLLRVFQTEMTRLKVSVFVLDY